MINQPRRIGLGHSFIPVSHSEEAETATIEWQAMMPLRLYAIWLEVEGPGLDSHVCLTSLSVGGEPYPLGVGVSAAETRREGRFDLWPEGPEGGGRLLHGGQRIWLELSNLDCVGRLVHAYALVDFDPTGLRRAYEQSKVSR